MREKSALKLLLSIDISILLEYYCQTLTSDEETKMRLTHAWLKKQINEYSKMMLELTNDESDKQLKTIWGERLNTLKSTLAVVETELGI